ncbi:MAG: lytic transglycosylase F [Flavobacteriales bacterium]|nr:MAG: lytic transglycosylase F [Flavobacteriales bacterium]
MHKRQTKYPVFFSICFLALTIVYCNKPNIEEKQVNASVVPSNLYHFDLQKIKERGKIIALTGNSSTSYFIYKGQPMGYEYELLELFAKHIDVDLEIVLVDDMDNVLDNLNEGIGDIVAANLTVTNERSQIVSFAEHNMFTRQVLIQKLPINWQYMKRHEIEEQLVRNPLKLAGKEVYVRKGTSFYTRLKNLSDEIGGKINIMPVPGNYDTEQLIEDVANGKIEYTVADENIALINKTYYPNIDIKTAVSFPQKIAWAVRKNSPQLRNAINDWLKKNRKTSDYATVYNKYFKSSKAQKKRASSMFSSNSGGKISEYDELIQRNSKILDWDWRLLASQVYQESLFDPQAESWVGAYGLMQVLPETAENFGIYNIHIPENNMKAGTLYLVRLEEYWNDKIPGEEERIKFVLASYNVGLGHVIDARRLTEKFGKDIDKWDDNVAEYLLLKSKPKYYTDEVVRHGYCRGQEPYNYVKKILSRYEHYKNVIS